MGRVVGGVSLHPRRRYYPKHRLEEGESLSDNDKNNAAEFDHGDVEDIDEREEKPQSTKALFPPLIPGNVSAVSGVLKKRQRIETPAGYLADSNQYR